jgi:hypothetical protein
MWCCWISPGHNPVSTQQRGRRTVCELDPLCSSGDALFEMYMSLKIAVRR